MHILQQVVATYYNILLTAFGLFYVIIIIIIIFFLYTQHHFAIRFDVHVIIFVSACVAATNKYGRRYNIIIWTARDGVLNDWTVTETRKRFVFLFRRSIILFGRKSNLAQWRKIRNAAPLIYDGFLTKLRGTTAGT